MNLTGLVVIVGLIVLLMLAIGVGAELDTDHQRRERQRLAEERRLRNEDRRQVRIRTGPLCDRCPYRDRL